ncbi:MAG: site-2 protease family protein [Chloroflexi bacterium]|nr:site-2 protease family protein [Chloroflexota bacterium]
MSGSRILAIARIAGVEIRVHVSWVLVIAVVTLGAAAQPTAFPAAWPDAARLAAGGVLAALFFASIVLHELAHAIVARRRGLPVDSITIVFFGGVTTIEDAARDPRDELAVAASGPLVSTVVGAIVLAFGVLLGPSSSVIGLGAAVVGSVNLFLGILNLVPALPLDGGRILHAVLWQAAGDAATAGRRTARVGRLIGAAALGLGILISLVGDAWTGLVVLVSGWFIVQGSRVTERRLAIEALLAGVRVGEVMERDLTSVGPTLTVDTFADQLLADGERTSVPVVDGDGLVGVIGVVQLRRITRRRWADLRASDLMIAPPTLPALAADDAAWVAMELLRRSGLDGIPVMAGRTLVGLFTRRAVVNAIRDRATSQAATR